MKKEIFYEIKNEIAIIKINRPEFNNAFSKTMLKEWLNILREIKDDDKIKGMILTGEGRVFCSGGSIEEMANGKLSGWEMKKFLTDYVHKIGLEMETFYKPTLAAINGPAIGAGLDMALMCDFRILSKKAIVGEAYIKLGLVAGDGGAYFLPRIIGISRALEMLLSGKTISPEQAYNWGLVNKVVEHENLLEESEKFLREIIQWPIEALKLMKKLVYNSYGKSLSDHFSEVASHMGILSITDEFFENAKKIMEQLKK